LSIWSNLYCIAICWLSRTALHRVNTIMDWNRGRVEQNRATVCES